ncbi:hypothetical protein KIPB_016468, partial [Kipferlia bialata]|eukprot:g16468.t1
MRMYIVALVLTLLSVASA